MLDFIVMVFGILLILVFLIFAIFLGANKLFNIRVVREVDELLSDVEANGDIIRESDLEGLPAPVQKWLRYSQVTGKEKTTSARTKQKAMMRLPGKENWMPVTAEQYFTVENPGFIWKAKVKAAPFLNIMGRDRYYQGKGNMLIKVLSLFAVADAKGKEIDQGTMVRFLAETMWIPSAVLNDYIKWEEVDDNSAKATMTYKGVTAEGTFTFNEKGEVIYFEAPRYGDFNGEYKLETWAIPVEDYKEFDGVLVPTKGRVTWKLKSGDLNWYNFEVLELEYNKPIQY